MANAPFTDRYSLTKTRLDDFVRKGTLRHQLWIPPDEIDLEDCTYFTVTPEYLYRLDLIAHQKLGDKRLWWVIAWVNGIDDLFEDMAPGQTLRIPSLRAIQEAFARARR